MTKIPLMVTDDGSQPRERLSARALAAPSGSRRTDIIWLAIALLATVIIRGGMLLALDPFQDDPDHYGVLARNLATRGAFSLSTDLAAEPRPTAFRPPLYPLVLTMAVKGGRIRVWRVAVLHVALAAAAAAAVFGLGRMIGYRPPSAAIASLLVSIDPILLHQATLLMTETLATTLAVVSWLLIARAGRKLSPGGDVREVAESRWPRGFGWWLAAGIALGLAVLCRPTFLIWSLLCMAAAVLFFAWQGVRLRRISWAVGALLLGWALLLAPWAIRNAVQLGKPMVTTTHGGYTLLLGNNPRFYRHLETAPAGTVWDSKPLDRERLERRRELGLSELEADQDAWQLAWKSIRQDPGSFVWASLVRLGRLWRPLPHRLDRSESRVRTTARWLIGIWYLTVYVLAVVGLVRLIRSGRIRQHAWIWLTGLLLLLTVSGLHLLFWSNLRMRAPLMPLLYLCAVACPYVRTTGTPAHSCPLRSTRGSGE